MSWSVQDSSDLYGIPYWGRGLFGVNDQGHLLVTPQGPGGAAMDVHELVEELVERGIDLPVLLRLPQIVERRVELMWAAFDSAIGNNGYRGKYRGVYPIKVNQQRQLVEDILAVGRNRHLGLEAGSKPELLVAMALLEDDEALLVCNGYKDKRYIEAALRAKQLGREAVIVIEKLAEVDTILEVASRLGVRPYLGVRAKLSSPGKGRWQYSSGDRAKFGLTASGIVELVERLNSAGYLDCLRMLHFHIGSQVQSIQSFKRAFRESSRLYVELVALGAPMGLMDVGGGVGVDYDGSKTTFEASRNYSVQEYATDVVSHLLDACDAADVPHPDIVTENGRATVAHGSVLLFDVLGMERRPSGGTVEKVGPEDPDLLQELRSVFDGITARTYQEAWHDAVDARSRAKAAFELGVFSLPNLARADRLFWQICGKVQRVASQQEYVPDELEGLATTMADTYYGNFSVFQSVPDAWAISQLFPCLPVHRLDEEPTRRGIIADLTCDSDGKLSRFVDRRDVKPVLELHPLREGEPYVLAVALVGAYQEILGDMHNLFGDTHAVHLTVDDEGDVSFDLVIEGDSVERVTGYVQYTRSDLVHRMRQATEKAIRTERITRKDAAPLLAFYREGLDSYTYLGH